MLAKSYTLGGVLKNSVARNGASVAFSFVDEKPVTYFEFDKQVNSLIALFEKNGISKNDKIALLSTNMPNWGIAFFAITSMGAVAVPILPDFHENEIQNILQHSEAKAIFVSETLYRKIENQPISDSIVKILIDNFAIIPQPLTTDIKLLNSSIVDGEKPTSEYTVDPLDLASIIYTSGTTGKSKGVMLSHKNLTFTAYQSSEIQEVLPSDRFLSLLPLSHTYENTIGLILPVTFGASVYYLRKIATPAVLLPAMQQVKPTLVLTVPLIIEKIYKGKILNTINSKFITRVLYKFPPTRKVLNRAAGKKLLTTFGGELKFFGIGGAKLDPEVDRFLIEAKFPHAIGYGLTETSPLLAGSKAYHPVHQSTGPKMPGIELKINNPNPKTNEGEIVVKGENVMMGYYKEPEITKECFTTDGWFKTGDLGIIDTNGNIHIKGRIKNMIIGSSGENIYPEDIEAIINRYKFVAESLVIQQKGKLVAMVHFNREELENAYINFKDQANHFVDEKINELTLEIKAYVNAHVNKFSQLQVVVVQPAPFEKTATQKIKRFMYY